jgi:hypothetical protein
LHPVRNVHHPGRNGLGQECRIEGCHWQEAIGDWLGFRPPIFRKPLTTLTDKTAKTLARRVIRLVESAIYFLPEPVPVFACDAVNVVNIGSIMSSSGQSL